MTAPTRNGDEMSITKKDFPKIIYVYLSEGGGEKWLEACDSSQGCASLDESRLVGIYKLEKVGKLLRAESVMVAA
jgi:hypothetical protein